MMVEVGSIQTADRGKVLMMLPSILLRVNLKACILGQAEEGKSSPNNL
jgi:hypothetical protein